MSNKLSTGICRIAALAPVLVLVFTSAAMPAYAGFEWVAPSDTTSSPAGGYASPPQAAVKGPEVISPVIITGDNGPALQVSPAYKPSAPVYPSPSYTPDVGTQPDRDTPPPSLPAATIEAPGGDIVQGFGSDIPLALALRQILPVGTNFSIDQNIDMETTVSYKGGKNWRDTLHDMLVPAGLVAREQGKTITVSRAGATATTTTTTVTATTTTAAPVAPPIVDNGPPVLLPAPDSVSRPAMASTASRAAAELPAVNINSPDGWSAERGDTLRKVLTDWCKRAGVELQWLAEYDYPMEASAHFNGGFEDAVRLLLAGFENARPQPIAELHSNPAAGQMLLVVQARGNNYSN